MGGEIGPAVGRGALDECAPQRFDHIAEVVHGDDRLALDAVALAEAGFGLKMHQALLSFADLVQNRFAASEAGLGDGARVGGVRAMYVDRVE